MGDDSFRYVAELIRDCSVGTGAALQLGKQDCHFDMGVLCAIARETGFLPPGAAGNALPPGHPLGAVIASGRGLSIKPDARAAGCVSDEAAFAALGYTTVDSVDISWHERATFLHDLNAPGLARLTGKKYDLVYDGGTAVAARKTAHATGNRTPHQNVYQDVASNPNLVYYGYSSLSDHPSLSGVDKVVVWGTGHAARDILLKRFDRARIAFLVDADPGKQGSGFEGLPILPPDALASGDGFVVVVGSLTHDNEIRRQIESRYAKNVSRIVPMSELLDGWDGAPAGPASR